MKILWVKAGKLLPVDSGGKIRSFNILRHLARQHEVGVLSYYGGRYDPDYEVAIRQQFSGAHTIHTAAPESTFAQVIDYVLRLPSAAPYAVRKFTDPKVTQEIARRFAGGVDVAVCDFLSASLNFPHFPSRPVVLFQHNVEAILWQRLAKTEKGTLRKFSYKIEARKMAAYETKTLRKCGHVIAVSDNDRDEMLKLAPGCSITVVPTGVDVEKYAVAPSASADPPIIVFTGSMDWEPNIDAMEYFCREIWPGVLAEFPRARFQIVGRTPHPRVQRLKSASVEVTGTVLSVAEYLRTATVVVVPLRIGGGTRLKIYEAMAMGKALVSTSVGAEGLDVTSGRDVILADDAQSFAAAILQLLRDHAVRQSFETNAADTAARYDWSQIARRFADVLEAAIPKQSVATLRS